MRPGQTQTGMSLYWPSYISSLSLHETGLKINSDRFEFVSLAGLRLETLVLVITLFGLKFAQIHCY